MGVQKINTLFLEYIPALTPQTTRILVNMPYMEFLGQIISLRHCPNKMTCELVAPTVSDMSMCEDV